MSSRPYASFYSHPFMLDNRLHTTATFNPYGYAGMPFPAASANDPTLIRFANPSSSSHYDNYGVGTSSTGRAVVFSPYLTGEWILSHNFCGIILRLSLI